MFVLINSVNSKGTCAQQHSCREGELSLADMKEPEALQTSSDKMRCSWLCEEMVTWEVIGDNIETTRATIIHMLLDRMLLLSFNI